jgi:drug/metabolite transporter (DMT)-like permease
VAETRRVAGGGLILVAGLLATISAIWIVACAATDHVAAETGAHACLYGGAGVCFLGSVAAVLLVPRWRRHQPWSAAAILCCLGVSFLGALVSFAGFIGLTSS